MKTHCKHGHEYTQENTYIDAKGGRSCRACQKARNAVRNKTPYHKQRVRDWKLAHPEARKSNHGKGWRNAHLLGRYGISEDDFQAILKQQNGVCAICHRTNNEVIKETGEPRQLHVDHDHVTEKVRGLLCGGCNKALGQFGDSSEMLDRAAQYLRKNS